MNMKYMDISIGNDEQPYKLIFVTGACRSGKTTLSRILGSMQNVEWIEEPCELALLLLMIQLHKMDEDFSGMLGQVFSGICKELVNNTILLRNGNFRPGDLSTIWGYKSANEIFWRLTNIHTRDEVQRYIIENNVVFVIDIPEILNASEFMRKMYNNLSIIHVVRNPYDVAEAVYQKHWYSDENMRYPKNNEIFRKYYRKDCMERYYIPWWIKDGDEEEYIKLSEYERAILYWISMVEDKKNENQSNVLKLSDFLIKYEDLVQHPLEILCDLYKLDLRPTIRTGELCKELQSSYISGCKRQIILNEVFTKKFETLKEIYKYE